jgi:2-polyprenyl-6-methoxyphenol hydroxylase-like FAD-dependent oxidoreductase
MSAFSALVPYALISENPSLVELLERTPSGFWAAANLHPDYRKRTTVVTYPCRDRKVLNMVVLHATREDQPEEEGWRSDAPTQAVVEVMSDFQSDVQSLIKLAPEIKVYTLLQRTPLDRLAHGRGVLVGDSAALFQPKTSQGGTMAFESAMALEHIFAGAKPEDVEDRAKLYNEFMHPRILTPQLYSDWSPVMGRNEIWQHLEKISSKPLPPMDASEFSESVFEFLWNHDVVADVKQFMSQHK